MSALLFQVNRRLLQGLNQYLAVLVIIVTLSPAGADTASSTVSRWCRTGETLLAEGESDSAFVCFSNAYAGGMSRDSLYYYLGEYYRTRLVYDSALALNFAAGHSVTTPLLLNILIQRYRIYSALEWDGPARPLLDTIRRMAPRHPGRILPDLQIRTSLGYSSEKQFIDTTFFWGDMSNSEGEKRIGGEYHTLDTKMDWRIAAIGRRTLNSGVKLGLSKPFYTSGVPWDFDSTLLFAGAFVQIGELLNGLGCSYGARVKKAFDTSIVVNNSLEFTLTAMRGQNSLAAMIGYEREDAVGASNVRHLLWGLASVNVRDPLTFTVLMNCNLAQAVTVSAQLPSAILFVDNAGDGFPDIYRDNAYEEKVVPDTVRLDTMSFVERIAFVSALNTDIAAAQRDSFVSITKVLPSQYFSVNPQMQVHLPLRSGFSIGFDCSWRLDWYPQPYEWDNIPLSYFNTSDQYCLLFNRSDSSLYGVTTLPGIQYQSGALSFVPEITSSFSHESLKRIDNTLGTSIMMGREWQRAGSIRILGSISKTWSTLSDHAPIDIPDWSWSFGLSWQKKIVQRKVFLP